MMRPTRSRIKKQAQNEVKQQKLPQISDESSSESDIENYLKPAHEIDLNSSFFQKPEKPFSEIEKNIFGGVEQINENFESSDDELQQEQKEEENVEINFAQMQEHLRKIEEAKKHVENYKRKSKKRKVKNDKINVAQLLSIGEKLTKNATETFSSESSESEDWEEVVERKEREIIPKKSVEITVQMPGVLREKKGVDLVAAMKRRLNRIKKENQIFMHKVSVLCWIAHGNFVNNLLNDEKFLGLALSLIPSEKCYPADRVNLGYLEQILGWFTNTVQNLDGKDCEKIDLEKQLHIDLSKKQASNKRIFVLIFICILRALGLQCRLVLSLVVVPLRPPSSELCSLSTKKLEEKKVGGSKNEKIGVAEKIEKDSSKNVAKKSRKIGKELSEIGVKKEAEKIEKDLFKIEKKSSEIGAKKASEKIRRDPSKIAIKNGAQKSTKIGKELSEIGVEKEAEKNEKDLPKIEKRSLQFGAKKESKKIRRDSSKIVIKNEAKKSTKIGKELSEILVEKEDQKIEKDLLEIGAKKASEKIRRDSSKIVIKNEAKESTKIGKESSEIGVEKEAEKIEKDSSKIEKKLSEIGAKKEAEEIRKDSFKNVTKKSTKIEKESSEIGVEKEGEKIENDSSKIEKKSSEIGAKKESQKIRKDSFKNVTKKSTKIEKESSEIGVEKEAEKNENDWSKIEKKSSEIEAKKESQKIRKDLFKIVIKNEAQRSTKIEKKVKKSSSHIKKEKSQKITKVETKKFPNKSEENATKTIELERKIGVNSQKSPNQEESETTTKKARFSTDLNKSYETTKKPNLMSLRKKIPQTDGADDSETDQPSTSKLRHKSLPDYRDVDSEDDFHPRSPFIRKNPPNKVNLKNLTKTKRSHSASPLKINVKTDIINLIQGRIVEENQKTRSRLVKTKRNTDDDYPEPIKKKKHDSDDDFIAAIKPKVKKRVQITQPEKDEPKKQGNDVWVEVYLEAEEKWISVDVIKKQIHCVNEIYKRATQPVTYVLAWDNRNYVKDVSKRYCPHWNTVTRKLRVDERWWEQTLRGFEGPKTARDREEDEELARLQLEKPLPTTIAEYKNHPLYALKRHLLKFEAIYPPDAVTLGFVRNEPVYSRECVHTLHSREIWLKHAKVVRPGEKPYKIVKARPKYDRLSNSVVTDQPLEIFGSWQVDDYVPPTAENGVVPRNEYGNVELFKACMLPKGTVHLQLPALNRVAKKLNIDCAPAVVGFDFHSGWSHPMFDGFVVCEEFKDTLIAAWEQEQEEAERRAQEKIEKRVYDNWKRLIKGLLIRERLKAKYDFGRPSSSSGDGGSGSSNKQKRKAKPVTFVVNKKKR